MREISEKKTIFIHFMLETNETFHKTTVLCIEMFTIKNATKSSDAKQIKN